ncbi:MAG: polysaccharide biosynthesis C-terminal domain-containing protein [Sedimentisphaerales bacterium]|jgi:O-antigen/teichoic acid export membrane protein
MLNKIKKELTEGRAFLQFGFLGALGQGFGMIAPLVIAKFFSPELLGSYYLTKMVLFFFSSLLLSYMQTPFIVFASQERAKTGKINKSFSIQCLFYAFSATLFLLVIVFGGKAIALFAKISLKDLLFVVLAFAGIALKTVMCNLFLALGQRMRNAFVEFVFGIASFVFVAIFCLAGIINIPTVFTAYFISGLLVTVMFTPRLDFGLLTPFVFDRHLFGDILAFAKWIIIGSTAAYFIGWGDSIVLRILTSMGRVGTYNLGYDIFKGTTMLIFIIYVYFLPFVSQHINDSVKIREYLRVKRPKIFLLGLAGIAVCFILAPYVFRIAYRGVYQDSVTILRILLIGSVLALYNTFYEAVFDALKKYRVTQTAVVLQVLLNLILDVILVPLMGIKGTAIAAVAGYALRVAIYEIYFRTNIRRLPQFSG